MTAWNGPICADAVFSPEDGFVEYAPNAAATYAYIAIFALFLICQIRLGLKYKAWFFTLGLICGLILEIIGYVGRIRLRSSPCELSNFLLFVTTSDPPTSQSANSASPATSSPSASVLLS